MYTSMALVALMGLLPTRASGDNPTWLNDYSQARKLGQSERRPLAVFIGSGEQGYAKLLEGGKLSAQARRLLAEQYVCVYVDTSTEAGRRLATDFAIQSSPPPQTGLVISDRSGAYQAFHFRGTLTDDELTRNLKRFSTPDYVVRSTVTSPSEERVSYYPPQNGAGTTSPPTYPSYPSYPSFAPASFGGGRGC
jgi:hypothetical protein